MAGENEKKVRMVMDKIKTGFQQKAVFERENALMTKREMEADYYNRLKAARFDNYKINRKIDNVNTSNRLVNEREDSRILAARGIKKAATGSKVMLPARVLELGMKLRSRMREGDSSAIQVAYIIAFLLDFVIDPIPGIAFIFSFILSPVLFMMLWGYGNWKVKCLRAILLLLEIIPGIGLAPLNVLCVWHANHVLKKRVKNAKIKYNELQMQINSIA